MIANRLLHRASTLSVYTRAFAAAAAASASPVIDSIGSNKSAAAPSILEFDDMKHNLKDITGAPGSRVVTYFTATWCGPCRMIGPHFADLAEANKGKAKFIKIDVDENGDTAVAFGVRAMPTFQIFADGKKVKEFMGANVEQLKKSVGELIEKS